jgi:hypothetical protein
MPSDFPRHHRSTSPDDAEVLMVVLVTIASVVVCGWIAVWLLSDVGARVARGRGRSARRDAPSEHRNRHPAVASTACSLKRPHPARVVDSPPSAPQSKRSLMRDRRVPQLPTVTPAAMFLASGCQASGGTGLSSIRWDRTPTLSSFVVRSFSTNSRPWTSSQIAQTVAERAEPVRVAPSSPAK